MLGRSLDHEVWIDELILEMMVRAPIVHSQLASGIEIALDKLPHAVEHVRLDVKIFAEQSRCFGELRKLVGLFVRHSPPCELVDPISAADRDDPALPSQRRDIVLGKLDSLMAEKIAEPVVAAGGR